jgi:DNA-binding transcriptional MerR regulator
VQDDTLISIGRFGRLTGLSVGALRHYDELSILVPAGINPETGYRSYSPQQVEAGRLIRRLRDYEMSLPEIRAFLGADAPGREERLAAHRARLQARADRYVRILHQLREVPMPANAAPAEQLGPETHRSLAAELFNHVWTLLEEEARTPEQDDEMIHAAHASRWHWAQTGVPDLRQRLAVGEWQCARVYAVLERGEPALYHAGRCVELAEGPGIEDWAVAAAYEGMARASRAAGDRKAYEEWRARAVEATAAIADEEEREVIEGDLATL